MTEALRAVLHPVWAGTGPKAPGILDVASVTRRGISGSGSTGLGLSIVRRMAADDGGEVRVDRGELGHPIVLMLPAPARPVSSSWREAPRRSRIRRWPRLDRRRWRRV